jgi:cysteinyl-tRNA synthetase
MTLRLYNTLTRSLQPFQPLEPGGSSSPGAANGSAGRVRAYACGPTIYDHAHIGNFRSFVAYDLLHRYLEWSGYDVRFVMNLTDVDDKTIDAAVRDGRSIAQHTKQFGEATLRDSDALGIRRMDAYPRATEYVPQMIEFVKRLVDKGVAYVADGGSVYFSIASFPGYGKLSGMDLDQVRPGARVAVDEYSKEDARDFVLWKAAKEKDESAGAAWDSPWGRGRPGWHLECSVMSLAELGETLDLHLGGEDLVFPHHEDEIAQSESATGKPFVRYWLHVKHLILEGRKMSKSLHNTITMRELLERGYEPAAIRHQLMSAQYRRELNFTFEGLDASSRAVQRLLDFETRLEDVRTVEEAASIGLSEIAAEAVRGFAEAMDDDLNSADALAELFMFVSEVNVALERSGGTVHPAERADALAALRSIDRVLGLIETARRSRALGDDMVRWVEQKIAERAAARQTRDFQRADSIRDELSRRGVVLEDGAGGTKWKFVPRTEETSAPS